MSDRNRGVTADPLFVGATRPPMRWGVTYAALLFNLVFTLEVFLLTKNLLTLLLAAPIHGVCMLLCAREARFFDLLLLWGRTRLPALLTTLSLHYARTER
jgi:type IV secretion system protein VirB3